MAISPAPPPATTPAQPARLLVLGAGAWGTALAIQQARRPEAERPEVCLWARRPEHRLALQHDRQNSQHLPGHAFPDGLAVAQGALAETLDAWRNAGPGPALLVLASPVAALAPLLHDTLQTLHAARPNEGMVWLSKGLAPLQDGSDAFPSALVAEALRQTQTAWPYGALSGPSFAQEVAQGLPVGLTLASPALGWARDWAQRLHGHGLRVYSTDDLISVEVGGAVKNVLAIAAGISDGLALGMNARAMLITRGLAEAVRLGVALGAKPEGFLGMAALGDLILTTTGDLSRNRRVGLALARSEPLPQILQGLGHVAEGVWAAPRIHRLAEQRGVAMPITRAVVAVLEGRVGVKEALVQLLDREAKDEA